MVPLDFARGPAPERMINTSAALGGHARRTLRAEGHLTSSPTIEIVRCGGEHRERLVAKAAHRKAELFRAIHVPDDNAVKELQESVPRDIVIKL